MPGAGSSDISLDTSFPVSIPGIIIAIAGFMALILGILASSMFPWYLLSEAKFCAFVGIWGFLELVVLYLLYLFSVLPKIPGPIGTVLMINSMAMTLFSLIAFIVSAAKVSAMSFIGYGGQPIATAIFSVILCGLFSALSFIYVQKFRSGSHYFHTTESAAGSSASHQASSPSPNVTASSGDPQAKY